MALPLRVLKTAIPLNLVRVEGWEDGTLMERDRSHIPIDQ